MIINACCLGLWQKYKGMCWGLGLVVLGAGRVVRRRHLPVCMTDPEKLGKVGNLIPMPEARESPHLKYCKALKSL